MATYNAVKGSASAVQPAAVVSRIRMGWSSGCKVNVYPKVNAIPVRDFTQPSVVARMQRIRMGGVTQAEQIAVLTDQLTVASAPKQFWS